MRSQARGGPRDARRWLVRVVAASAAVSALVVGCGRGGDEEVAKTSPPPPVQVTPVVRGDVPVDLEWNATIEGSNTAQIRPQVAGYLMAILYRQGSYVQAGTPLFQIDDRLYQENLLQAKGQVAQALAALEKARGDVRRFEPLARTGAASRQELAHAEAERDAAAAQVAAARAAVGQAELQVSFTKVSSPIDGVAGIVNVEIGALVGTQTVLTTVSTLDPIKVRFALTERQYLEAAPILQRLTLTGPTMPSADASLEGALRLFLADGSEYPYPGTILRVGLAIDPGTGTLPLEAQFPNPELLLRPGQFARAKLRTDRGHDVLIVPQRAITELQGIDQLAIVDPESHVVSMRRVTLGPKVGPVVVIERGVREGELVVVEGLQGLSDGTHVAPRPAPPTEVPETSAPSGASRTRDGSPPNGGGG